MGAVGTVDVHQDDVEIGAFGAESIGESTKRLNLQIGKLPQEESTTDDGDAKRRQVQSLQKGLYVWINSFLRLISASSIFCWATKLRTSWWRGVRAPFGERSLEMGMPRG